MDAPMIPYQPWPSNSEEALKLFEQFEKNLSTRRSVREYSSAPVSKEQIRSIDFISGKCAERCQQATVALCRRSRSRG